MQGEGEAVKFEFADVLDLLGGGEAGFEAIGPGAEVRLVVGVVEREHGAGVGEFGEAVFGLAADALGRGVGGDEVGVGGLEEFEAVHEGVVLGVGQLGGVKDVVEVLMVAEVGAEGFDLLVGREGLRGCSSCGAGRHGEILVGGYAGRYGSGDAHVDGRLFGADRVESQGGLRDSDDGAGGGDAGCGCGLRVVGARWLGFSIIGG